LQTLIFTVSLFNEYNILVIFDFLAMGIHSLNAAGSDFKLNGTCAYRDASNHLKK